MSDLQTTPLTPIQAEITRYMHAQRLTFHGLAKLMTAVLQERQYKPQSVSFQAVAFWRAGMTKPGAQLFEYLRDHTQDESLREFAENMLAAMDPGSNGANHGQDQENRSEEETPEASDHTLPRV